ncbi:hypothetical protein SAMN02745866_00570 [Alteromonadaceae bacterium Bs31]|nr:hypothetical protein SAMN02745866_00570 [Alteromonadaceae bacterium Bs31]
MVYLRDIQVFDFTSRITGGKFSSGAGGAAFMYALSAGVRATGNRRADKSGEPADISNEVKKVFGEDKVTVTTKGDETFIDINLKVKKGTGLLTEDFEAIMSDIVRDWNTQAEIDGHTYHVKTTLTVDNNILSSGDFSIESWSSLPPDDQRDAAGMNIGKRIYVNRNVVLDKNGAARMMSRSGTAAHEFGHLIGLEHQKNVTNSIMSYADVRDVSSGTDLQRLAHRYGN